MAGEANAAVATSVTAAMVARRLRNPTDAPIGTIAPHIPALQAAPLHAAPETVATRPSTAQFHPVPASIAAAV